MGFEAFSRRILNRFLDGPPSFQPFLLRPGARYRSSTLALAAWSWAILRSVLSPVALWLLPVMALAVLYASVAMEAPMRVVIPLFLAIFLVETVAGMIFRPRLEINRTLPERVRAGSSFRTVFRVRNRRRLPAYDLTLDPFDYAFGLKHEVAATVEVLPGRSSCTASGRVRAVRRGRYRIPAARAESGFPFHLIKWSCRNRGGAMLSVYPAFTPLRCFAMPVGKRCQASGSMSYSRVGESADLIGVRDYRDGDDIRHIDWPGSARIGSFVVKEFEENELKRVALIVDTFVPPPPFWSLRFRRRQPDERLEAALQLAAALADYFSRGEAVVELFAAGPTLYRLETGRNAASFESVCDILAGIEPSPKPALNQLEPELFRDVARIGGAVVLLLGFDADRRRFIEQLHGHGVSTRILLIGDAFEGELPEGCSTVSPRAVQNGEVVSL